MTTKPTNPKDAVGSLKWGSFSTIPMTVIAEMATGMTEGALKYGRHNYRESGVRASIYFDAAMRHLVQWWEGEDIDADSGLPHVVKALCSLVVLRDAQIRGMLNDDRPPEGHVETVREATQRAVDEMHRKYPEPKVAVTARRAFNASSTTAASAANRWLEYNDMRASHIIQQYNPGTGAWRYRCLTDNDPDTWKMGRHPAMT